MPPDLSVVIVSWNTRDLLEGCLQSVLQSDPRAEVIVVDNASDDGSPQMVAERFPGVRLIQPGQNTGFSKGNNLGMQAAGGRLILLLNSDTLVQGDALPTLTAYLDDHPAVGLVGPQLLNPDGTVQSSRRRFPTLLTAVFESTWMQGIAPRRVLSRYYVEDRPHDEAQPVDWLTGAALLVRREVVEALGGFDEGFFMYSEELDWQRRIRDAGWEIAYVPAARIVHYGGKSSEQVVPQRHIAFQTSKVRYFRKHHGPLAAALVRFVLLANYLIQIVIEGAKWLLGHKRSLRSERVAAYWGVLRSGLRG